MFYTKTAKVVAGFSFVLGLLSFLTGLAVATGVFDAEVHRRVGLTSGKSIDLGLSCMFAAVVLGVLAEISQSLADIAKDRK